MKFLKAIGNWLLGLVVKDVAVQAVGQLSKIAAKLDTHAQAKLTEADTHVATKIEAGLKAEAAKVAAVEALKVADKLRELVK